MSQSVLTIPRLQNEEAAYEYVEARLWPKGPVCPHCGSTERLSKMKGTATRIGLYKCYVCRKQFTVKIGTIFEDSHIPLRLWLQAIYLLCSSKKGISSNQLSRTLGVTLKTAWFMSHRIREAMRSDSLRPFGSRGGAVECDETFLWDDPDKADKVSIWKKNKILSLVDRRTGNARSTVLDELNAKSIIPILEENIGREARIITDDAPLYNSIDGLFAEHHTVNHSIGEYVRYDNPAIHTNTVEGFFSIFKRGMKGVYQHCAKKHMHRYLAEFDFRYSTRIAKGIDDSTRADRLLKGVSGKRLTYATTHSKT
ncbi:MAG: IS1595 family transposase [Syntrophobacteraceae bacterium]